MFSVAAISMESSNFEIDVELAITFRGPIRRRPRETFILLVTSTRQRVTDPLNDRRPR